jgi:hypothetical protein
MRRRRDARPFDQRGYGQRTALRHSP